MACFGHWVTTPPQKVAAAAVAAVQVVAWTGQLVATAGHWVLAVKQLVNWMGHWVTAALPGAGQTVATTAMQTVALAGQVV